MRRASRRSGLAAVPLLWLSWLAGPSPADTADGVVRAVLFSSPTCPHCRKVREEVLPPLWERYGARFQVAVLSTTTPPRRSGRSRAPGGRATAGGAP